MFILFQELVLLSDEKDQVALFKRQARLLATNTVSARDLGEPCIKSLYIPRCGPLQSRHSSTRGLYIDVEEVLAHACAVLDASIHQFMVDREEVTESNKYDYQSPWEIKNDFTMQC